MGSIFKRGQVQEVFKKHYQFVQHLWTKKMTNITLGMSRMKLICLLFAFVVFSGGFFVYRIMGSFSNTASVSLPISSISKVITPMKTNNSTSINTLINEYKYSKIELFNKYLDSIKIDPMRKKIYDSIKKNRAGLLDSLAFVEQYYYINFKENELWRRKHYHLKN